MRQWVNAIRSTPSGVLLIAQLLAVLAYPFAGQNDVGRALLGVFSVIVLAVAVYAVRTTPALTWVAVLLGVPVVLLTVAEGLIGDNQQVTLWSSVFHAAFYGYTAYGLIRYLFDDTWVTRDEIFAVGANFTVVVVDVRLPVRGGAGHLARLVHGLPGRGAPDLPRAALPVVRQPHQRRAVRRCGGAPAWPGRSCILEQVAGVMYVALIIARVVGLTIHRWRS